jgi:4-carboxymuconolactone decarboxylase
VRIPPLPREEWGEEEVAAARAGFGERATEMPNVPNVLGLLLRHPQLAGRFLAYNARLLTKPTVEPRLRELAILRVAWSTRAPYEWLQHVRMARMVGVTDDEIAAIAGTGAEHEWSPLEADVLAATDQLLERHRIDDDTWARLASELDERELIELLFVVGTYTALAMVFNSVELELDPDLHEIGAPAIPD